MKFAYADPPYLGCAQRLYGDPTYDSIDAHVLLFERLQDEFPDGWAYSLHEPSLPILLPFAPLGIRVMPWVKTFASFKPGVGVAYAWEPVFVWGGRPRTRRQATARDWCAAPITMRRGFPGAKPEAFCYWLFEVLNVQSGDEFVDVFPGSGAVTNAWDKWSGQMRMNL